MSKQETLREEMRRGADILCRISEKAMMIAVTNNDNLDLDDDIMPRLKQAALDVMRVAQDAFSDVDHESRVMFAVIVSASWASSLLNILHSISEIEELKRLFDE